MQFGPRQYIWELLRQLPNAWRKGAIAMTIVISAILFGLWLAGWKLETYPTSLFLGGTALVAVADVILLLPYQLWKANRAQIEPLKERIRSKMRVAFDQSDPNCDYEISFTDQSKSRCIRLRVENTGSAPISECEAWLSVKEMPMVSGFRMFWAGSGARGRSANEIPETVDLVGRVPRYVQVFRIHEVNAVIPGTAGEVWPLGENHSFEIGKTYHFDVALKGRDDAETVVRTIRLNWNGNWQTTEIVDVT